MSDLSALDNSNFTLDTVTVDAISAQQHQSVSQPTSNNTDVTLDQSIGTIFMNQAMTSGSSASFKLKSNRIKSSSFIFVTGYSDVALITNAYISTAGEADIRVYAPSTGSTNPKINFWIIV